MPLHRFLSEEASPSEALQNSTQCTLRDIVSSSLTSLPTEWPWGLLLSDKRYALCPANKQRITIGRSKECDIVVDDPRISAVHFALSLAVEVHMRAPPRASHRHHRMRSRSLSHKRHRPRPNQQQQRRRQQQQQHRRNLHKDVENENGYAHEESDKPHTHHSTPHTSEDGPPVTQEERKASELEPREDEDAGNNNNNNNKNNNSNNNISSSSSSSTTSSAAQVKVYLEDLSSNGTYVNDRRVGRGRRCELQSGDDIGAVLLPVKAPHSACEAAAAAGALAAATHDGGNGLVDDVALLASLPRCRSYVNHFCFQAYQTSAGRGTASPSTTTTPLTHSRHEEEEEEEEKEKKEEVERQQTSLAAPSLPLSIVTPRSVMTGRPIRWQRGRQIGQGASGTVYAGIDLDTGRMVALKVLHQRSADNEDAADTSGHTGFDDSHIREMFFLTHLVHHRVVQCLGVQKVPEGACLILEYVAGGTLRDLMRNFGAFHESLIRLYTLQVLQGMEYLQSCGVVHGDLKSTNVLMSEGGLLKITDFGTSRFVQKTYTTTSEIELKQQQEVTQEYGRGNGPRILSKEEACSPVLHRSTRTLCGTPIYMSPELVRTQESTYASDVWALGCMVYEMAAGNPPWEELHNMLPQTVVLSIGQAKSGPSLEPLRQRGSSPQLLHFLECAFHMDPNQRSTVAELLKHPFIVGLPAAVLPSPVLNMFPSTPPAWNQLLQVQQPSHPPNRGDTFASSDRGEYITPISEQAIPLAGESGDLAEHQSALETEPSPLDLGTTMESPGMKDHRDFAYELCLKKILTEEGEEGRGDAPSVVERICPEAQRRRMESGNAASHTNEEVRQGKLLVPEGAMCMRDACALDGEEPLDEQLDSPLRERSGITVEFTVLPQLLEGES